MLKIRLRRMGAIRQPHYRIVVADARSPRDGAFIESLGHYNPLTNPATIHLDVAKYDEWKRKGAQPTDAVASLVKQYRAAHRAAEAAEAPASPDRRTRTASGKRTTPASSSSAAASAAPAPEAEAAIVQGTEPDLSAPSTVPQIEEPTEAMEAAGIETGTDEENA